MIAMPGTYYIGDPCYVLGEADRKRWTTFLDKLHSTSPANRSWPGVSIEFEGSFVFVARTKFGDGRFRDQRKNEYPVDAGMIAAVPIVLIRDNARALASGRIVTFERPFEASRDPAGTFTIGKVKIKTGDKSPRWLS